MQYSSFTRSTFRGLQRPLLQGMSNLVNDSLQTAGRTNADRISHRYVHSRLFLEAPLITVAVHIPLIYPGAQPSLRRTTCQRAPVRSSEATFLETYTYTKLGNCVVSVHMGHPRNLSLHQGAPCAHSSSLYPRCHLHQHPPPSRHVGLRW